MFTPQGSTSHRTSTHRSTSHRLSTYERILAGGTTAALALVAALAWSLPSVTTPSAEAAANPSSAGQQIARGKATVPSSAAPADQDRSALS